MAETSVRRLELEANLAEVSSARRFIRTNLADVSESVSADAQLIVSELVTNAVEHGFGGPVVVELHRDADDVSLTVESVGLARTVGDVAEWHVAPAEHITGRGLGIVREVAKRVDVHRANGRLVITAHLTI